MMIPFVISAIESNGDREMMTDIYLRHRALMLKVAWDYTQEAAEVDDIVSDSCVMLIQHLEDLKELDENMQRAYIVTTVRHKAIDACRKKARELSRTADADPDRLEPPVSFEHRITVQTEIDMVKTVLLSLPQRERETLTMKFFECKSDREIAEVLGVSENAVRKYIMRGRHRLKAALYEGEDAE